MGISAGGGSLGLTQSVSQAIQNMAAMYGTKKVKQEMELANLKMKGVKMALAVQDLGKEAQAASMPMQFTNPNPAQAGQPVPEQAPAGGPGGQTGVQGVPNQAIPTSMQQQGNQDKILQMAQAMKGYPQASGVKDPRAMINQFAGSQFRMGKDMEPEMVTKAELEEEGYKGTELKQKIPGTPEYEALSKAEEDRAVRQATRISSEKGLAQGESVAVAGAQSIDKSVDNAISFIDKGVIKSNIDKIALDTGRPYLVSGDMESLQSEMNNLKSSIPFTKGGKQLTPFEARLLFRLLDTFGKEPETIKKDLQRFKVESDKVARGVLTEAQAEKMISGMKPAQGEEEIINFIVNKSSALDKQKQALKSIGENPDDYEVVQ